MSLSVNDILLDEQDIIDEMARLKPKHDEVFRSMGEEEREGQLRAWAEENVIERVLLRQAAERFGEKFPRSFFDEVWDSFIAEKGGEPTVLRMLSAQGTSIGEFRRAFELQLCVDRLIESVTRDTPRASEQELRSRYEADPSRFATSDLVRAGHIVLHVDERRTREKALVGIREVQAHLKAGVSFEELAGRYSDCPENDGDLGWFPRGEMVEEFEEVVFGMAAGEVSDIIESPFGFHIAKLYERRVGSLLSFAEAKDALSEDATREMNDHRLEAFIDSLRANATVIRTS